MPYLIPADKLRLAPIVDTAWTFILTYGLSKGDLNYLITKLGQAYVARHHPSYNTISDAISAMNDAAAEFRRRRLDPYENEKIIQNGDVY